MAMNRRLAVCTRWRPLLGTLLTIGLFIGLSILITFVQDLGKIPYSSLSERAYKLQVGMSEQELVKIMGKPAYMRAISSGEETSLFPWEEEGIRDVLQEYGQVVEYCYGKRKFGWTAVPSIEGIYLDRDHRKIIYLRVKSMHWDLIPTQAYIESLLLLAVCIVLSWVGVRRWCKRQRERRRRNNFPV